MLARIEKAESQRKAHTAYLERMSKFIICRENQKSYAKTARCVKNHFLLRRAPPPSFGNSRKAEESGSYMEQS